VGVQARQAVPLRKISKLGKRSPPAASEVFLISRPYPHRPGAWFSMQASSGHRWCHRASERHSGRPPNSLDRWPSRYLRCHGNLHRPAHGIRMGPLAQIDVPAPISAAFRFARGRHHGTRVPRQTSRGGSDFGLKQRCFGPRSFVELDQPTIERVGRVMSAAAVSQEVLDMRFGGHRVRWSR